MKAISLFAATAALCATISAQQVVANYTFEGNSISSVDSSNSSATNLTITNDYMFGGPSGDTWLCLSNAWNNVGGSIFLTVTPEAGKSLSFTTLTWLARTNAPSQTDSVRAATVYAGGTAIQTFDPLTHNTDYVVDLTGVASLRNIFDPVTFEIRFVGNPNGQTAYEIGAISVQAAECVQNLTTSENRIVWLPMAGMSPYWRAVDGVSFVENANGTAVLTGAIVHRDDPCKRFTMNIVFGGRVNPGQTPPAGSPKTNSLINSNLVSVGGPIDLSTWRYYTTLTGTLTGRICYEGALLNLTRMGEAFQIGMGANMKTVTYGASSWFNVAIASQPTNSTYRIDTGLHNGDFNFDLGTECVCLGGEVANWFNYGAGVAGCDGVPSLTMTEDPLINTSPRIRIGNAGTTPRPCAVFWGFGQAQLFIPLLGGDILVAAPWVAIDSHNVTPGDYSFTCTLENDACMVGDSVYAQAVCIDPCGPTGFSLSRGMCIEIGDL